jgi:hypothetical protein
MTTPNLDALKREARKEDAMKDKAIKDMTAEQQAKYAKLSIEEKKKFIEDLVSGKKSDLMERIYGKQKVAAAGEPKALPKVEDPGRPGGPMDALAPGKPPKVGKPVQAVDEDDE